MANFIPVKLAYESYEPVSGMDEELCPVIFLHGLSDSKEIWGNIPQIIADKTKRKAYSLDARNHGDSEWSEIFDFDLNVDDLFHFMDAISVEKAVLVGHSMGGITSIKASLKCHQRVEMIFVEDMYVEKVKQKVLNSVLKYNELCQEAVEQIPFDCDEVDVQRFIVNYLFDKSPRDMKDVGNRESLDIYFALKRDENGRFALKANLKVIQKALMNGDTLMSESEGLFEGPAFFIYGSISRFRVNEREKHIRRFFPNAEFFPIEGADHTAHPQFPNEFTEVVVKCFLKHQRHENISLQNSL